MSNELKPCPFCGFQHPITIESGGRVYVECPLCGAETSSRETEEEAIEAWNTRAERTCTIENQYDGFPIHRIVRLGRCSKCGEIINTEHKFCFECGAKVVE